MESQAHLGAIPLGKDAQQKMQVTTVLLQVLSARDQLSKQRRGSCNQQESGHVCRVY